MKAKGESSLSLETVSVVVDYGLYSSLLAVINKYAITHFPFPGLLTALQYFTIVAGVWLVGKARVLHHDPFVWSTTKFFLQAAFVFYLAIFTNTKLLKQANVDTFIVFRSSTPLLVALMDTFFHKQVLPSPYSGGIPRLRWRWSEECFRDCDGNGGKNASETAMAMEQKMLARLRWR